MKTTSTKSDTNALAFAASIVTGALVVVGLAAVLWMVVSRRTISDLDPQAEIDRRINDLEHSLSRLQEVFGQAIRG